jgi:hypothetical protein
MTKIQELLGLSILSLSASYVISKYVFKHPISEKGLLIAAGVSFTSIFVYNYIKNKKSGMSSIDGKQIALPDTYSSYGRLKDILSAQGYDLQIKK